VKTAKENKRETFKVWVESMNLQNPCKNPSDEVK